MPDHDELSSQVGPWVLGALDAAEAAEMELHVQGCSTCQVEAARLRGVVNALPLAVDEVQPPARLRARVLAAAVASGSPDRVDAGRRARQERIARPRLWAGLPRLRRAPAPAAAAALLVILLAGIAIGALAGRQSAPTPPSQVARYQLTGHGQLAGARATVIDLRADGVVLVDFSGLPALQVGKVYEVWLINSKGQADPATVFVPDTNGDKVVLVSRPLAGYREMAVTTEVGPDGVQAPTQQPELYGNLA
ncbi:MAG TPA: anti-sigma factor [Candidatus Sulfotelmatobacter sp.]|nr:anti-sigma factor [Candidatus Sulfotelmatobacter sp.]